MDLKTFFAATCGRLLAASTALALMGAGVIALVAAEPPLLLVTLLCLALAVGSIVLVGLSLERFGGEAVVLVLVLPPLGGLYLAGIMKIGQVGAGVGVPLLVLGLVPLWIAVRSGERAPRTA